MAEAVRPKKSRQAAKAQDKKKKVTTEIKKNERSKPESDQESVSGVITKIGLSSSSFTTVDKSQNEETILKPDEVGQSEDQQLLPDLLVTEMTVENTQESKSYVEAVSIAIVESKTDSKQHVGLDNKDQQIHVDQTKKTNSHHSQCNNTVPEIPEANELSYSRKTDIGQNEENLNAEPAVYSASDQMSLHSSSISSQKVTVDLKKKEVTRRKDSKNPAILILDDHEKETVDMKLHDIIADLPVQLTIERLYPDLPLEFTESPETAFTEQVSLPCRTLYPAIPRGVAPFTKEELKMFALGSWLENVDTYTEEFLSVANQDKNDLFELLMNYGRCRKQLLLAEAELETMTCDYKSIKTRLWTFKEEQLTIQGVCADQSKVTAYHRFQVVEMDNLVLGELQRILDIKADHLHQTLALHAYTSVLSRLQVESYIFRLLNSSSAFRAVAVLQRRDSLFRTDVQEVDCSHSDLQLLKESISVLFTFTRRTNEDSKFHSDILLWLQKLVAVLHRVGSAVDHLFLLNHILRCPAGVSKWAAPFVKISVFDNPSGIFLFMQALALLLSPIKHRPEFLINMKPSDKKSPPAMPEGKDIQNWTLVDEAGEEDEDPDTSWLLLSEDDLVTLLSQFPFDELFKQLLGITVKGEYKPENTTCDQMMKIIGFASSLVDLLAVGLETFNRVRYRQFVKRIGQMIRRTVCYISDHWAQYVTFHKEHGIRMNHQFYSLEKLQVEFDELFLRAVLHVLKAKRLGIWLFMSEMPFETLSIDMIWKLFYILHCAESENIEGLCARLHFNECKDKLKDPEHKQMFEKCLSNITNSEGICLLTTFAHMTQPKQGNVDQEFVKTVALEIYEVAYVSLCTRENFSKVGRELLATISTVHPDIISILLDRIRETIEKVGMVSLYLFKELPLHQWKISSTEMDVIREWLLNYNLSTVENKLACIILEGLNWGLDEQQSTLALDPCLHTEVALMVLEVYQKYLTDKPYSGFISESIKQVSYLANVVRLNQTPEALFNHWAWELVVRLKLHNNHSCNDEGWPPINNAFTAPEMNESPTLHPLSKAVRAGIPIGCYLALSITSIGHSVDKFCSEGIPLLGVLVQSKHLKAVVHVLDKILPLFYPCQYYLLKNEQFIICLQLFLQTDSGVLQGVTQQVTQKVAQHLTGISYGENIKLLNSMIQTHVSESNKPGRVGAAAVLEFWILVLTSQQLWHRDKSVLFLMDSLCKVAFLHQQEDCLQKPLYQLHKTALGYHGDRGLLTSFMSWMLSGNITPSFIEGSATSTEVWFSWMIFNMEAIFEEDSQLRRYVELELISKPSVTPDQALRAQSHLKFPVVPSIQRLMIYRWAHQALATPADHPLLPLIWQKFFFLYLHRPGPEFGLPVSGCIGKRYFHSTSHSNLLKEMKKRLVEIADFHHAASKAVKIQKNMDHTDNTSTLNESTGICLPESMTSPELHKELLRLFHVFAFWLDDMNLQRTDLYLPSLPVQYDTHRLAKVMQNQQDLWTEYVDSERIKHEFHETLNLWTQLHYEPFTTYRTSSVNNLFDSLLAKDRILNNLKTHDVPVPTVSLQYMKAPVPDIVETSLSDKKVAIKLIQQNLNILRQQAKIAAQWEHQQIGLDSELLGTLPKLYSNREEQITMKLECRGSSLNHVCQGAAKVSVKCKELYENNAIKQQLDALTEEIKQLQNYVARPPPQNIAEAAVHVENFITALVNAFKQHHTETFQKVGIALFYEIVSFVCDETQRHPPTRQFFTSCIEILGQVFLSCAKTESKTVLKKVLQNRRLCNLLSPYFTPNISPDEFVSLYEEVVKVLHTDSGDVIFMLLTKFDLMLWMNSTKPIMSERTRLLEIIHMALTLCGFQPVEEVQMAFNIFCKHWMYVLQYQFPDHYSGFLRLLMQSSSEQRLNPDCWKVALKTLNCTSENEHEPRIARCTETQRSQKISLSFEQVLETIQWLSDFFFKLRLSKPDLRSFGLFSKWTPYMNEVKKLLMFLARSLIDSEVTKLAQGPPAGSKNVAGLQMVYSKLLGLFRPWLLVLNTEEASNNRSYPWLEIDTPVASGMVKLFTKSVDYLHQSFKGRLIPGQRSALWFHLMHYCETCTVPKMPEYILYTYHSEYSNLPWKELYPDQALMDEFFKVERGSPKSCFLFLGNLLCEVNWVSVLSDARNPQPLLQTRKMVVCLLFMMVFLSKEDKLTSNPESPLHSLLGQSNAIPWHFVDVASYQNVISYFSSHYSPSVVILKIPSAELILKLLKVAAGFSETLDTHSDATHKCRAYIHQVVQCLITLDQNAQIVHAQLEHEMITLLDDIVIFNPPDVENQMRHMAIASLFMEVLMILNNTSVTSAESLRVSLRSWIETKMCYNLSLPLLTATCQSLASVKHMAETTEGCIMAYFRDGACLDQYFGWGPILVSLQVPELTVEEFIKDCLDLGSYLTLYVYILQHLNMEQTLSNEMKMLVLLNKWIEQAFPSNTNDEAKLFLWWHKVLELTLIQLKQKDVTALEFLMRILNAFQMRQNHLAEEKLSAGILGAIGLGRKSPLSNRFRVVARSMSAFLLVQLPPENRIRIKPGTELHLSPKAQQALNGLESMSLSKQYADYQEEISQATVFIKNPNYCILDGNKLLAVLISFLYPDTHYLDIIR
ncbi:ectopic P granules protein 5 homolog isoform X2 [Scyliorhinus canicula]|uniref:ectopic P granules protein 5 homolog isoform X2 n=1 Tax=Scyliorhinus canicula TaxID=7830 RepID=UPI0018F708CB|nr:ectopic P granules protein 5 homolog isoform X2 [Scyliorhinus canicula]